MSFGTAWGRCGKKGEVDHGFQPSSKGILNGKRMACIPKMQEMPHPMQVWGSKCQTVSIVDR